MKSVLIKALRVLTGIVFVFMSVWGYSIYERTLTDWCIPVGVACLVVVFTLSLYKKWSWLTDGKDKTLNMICHVVCVGIAAYTFFLAGNYYCSDAASRHEEEVTVQKKYRKTHKKMRRVGRGRMVADGERYEYYLQVSFKDGTLHTLHVPLSTYNKTRMGGTRTLALQKGAFGFPVIVKAF